MDSHSAFVYQGSNSQSQSQSSHSRPHSHGAMQFPSELEQGADIHHVQHHSRHNHDDLSSLAISAVDVVGFHASELHGFSDVFKTRPSQSVAAAPYRGFGAPAESLLVDQTLLLPDARAIPDGWDDESGRLSRRLPSDGVGGPIAMAGESRNRQDGQDGQKEGQGSSHLPMKMVEKPPDLARWRQRLFDLEKMVVLSQDEFETYFPWVDNVYSHRSTQQYKRKPFITHYWDCRLKGRPPGTAKSDDPTKKKRKRLVRERDQCEVKIKITQYTAGAALEPLANDLSTGEGTALGDVLGRVQGKPFWTIQRINGNGVNGNGQGKPETHRHTLEKSDEIKKNSIQRWLAARDKDAKQKTKPSRWKATGDAAVTAKKHAADGDVKFYAACFCPFSQRVWITLEVKGLQYQYCETDPFRTPKPTHFLEANPRGLVPAIRQGEWACGESSVILEYLEDIDRTVLLLPTDPKLKANCRLWIDFINARVLPSFHTLLAASDDKLEEVREKFQCDLKSLVHAADENGPYFLGDRMCLVDIHLAPFALWLPRLPQRFGDLTEERWKAWLAALESNTHVRNTTSGNRLYMDTVDRLIQGCRDHLE